MEGIKKTIKKIMPVKKMYGYKPEIVKKMNKDKPYCVVLHAQFPKGNIKRQMKEKHPKEKRFKIPVVFKNEFHYTCLSDDYYAYCQEEIRDFIQKTYDIEDDDQDLCDIFVPEMMEPNNEFKITDNILYLDLRHWVYTSEHKEDKKKVVIIHS